ncbi:uncharacterized protein LOC126660668 isoform X2 [Mercurialis annua]|uniref:uncharacterized protein LOC126660668 isoform X2 n=1 Tax=Mercurialis annua TaxID=3986 RepID=UPI00215E364D|nr:uncharacterized protein LOC126660668 isoform X2 [Mercurialis annua]
MKNAKKMKILCLHGFRTSGSFLHKQITKWDPSIFAQFDLGATLSALLLGYQAQGKVLKEHPPMKLFISISGSKFRDPKICDIAYKDIIKVKSVHFIGAKDWLKLPSEELSTAFDSPLIIRHPQGHTVPRLDEAAIEQLHGWATEISQCNNEETKLNEEGRPSSA